MRIIAGKSKGLKISAPDYSGTRPSLDRVKEAYFGSIQFDIPGSTVLDLFAGSGSLGLEAASRGARLVYLNDLNSECIKCIRTNTKNVHLEDVCVITQMDYREALKEFAAQGIKFQIILIDAPYKTGDSNNAIDCISKNKLLSEHGYIIIEHDWDLKPVFSELDFCLKRQKKFGTCGYTILESR